MAGAPEPELRRADVDAGHGAPDLRARDEHAGAAEPDAASYPSLIAAGLNDWGGVSPVTPDHVNPEAPWPQIERLQEHTEQAGKVLVERSPCIRSIARERDAGRTRRWSRACCARRTREGFARADDWCPGEAAADRPPASSAAAASRARTIERILAAACAGAALRGSGDRALFQARGAGFRRRMRRGR